MLTFVDNNVDMTTGTIKLKGTFPNSDHKLWPGQYVNVVLRLTTQPHALVVPNQAVQNGQDGNFVYLVGDDRKVLARPVTTGPRVGQDVVIKSGLQDGDTVVTEGQLRLSPGSQVAMRDANNPGGGGGGRRRGGGDDQTGGAAGAGQPGGQTTDASKAPGAGPAGAGPAGAGPGSGDGQGRGAWKGRGEGRGQWKGRGAGKGQDQKNTSSQ
jgi:multidrug efflux system membrane fusion protein